MRKLLIPSYGTRYTPLPRQKTLSPFQVGVEVQNHQFQRASTRILTLQTGTKKISMESSTQSSCHICFTYMV